MNRIDFQLENDKTVPLRGDATIQKNEEVNENDRIGFHTVNTSHIVCVIII